MRVLINPSPQELEVALKRPKLEAENLDALIAEIFATVEKSGDIAISLYNERFDNFKSASFELSREEWEEAEQLISEELKTAIKTAARNIEGFHTSQVCREQEVETTEGVVCWRKSVAIQNVGLYIPGGTAPLFSTVLMLGIPAKIADCKNTLLCTPPSANGKINPAILYAAKVAGIKQIFKVGGAQAIAAMSLGTESISKVDKIFGPGNQYVTAAKQYAQRFGMAIDMPAGPSEVLVAADDSIPASFVAADLLAQAEHGIDSQVIFLTDSSDFVEEVRKELAEQLAVLPRAEIAKQALENSTAIIQTAANWSETINAYAPEHLIIMGKYEQLILENVVNAGSVFIGQYTAESFGDYASGTNHTLPTAGFARSYSGVSLDSFVKKITYQRVSEIGLQNLGQTVITMAEAEGLAGHAKAVSLRGKFIEERGHLDYRSMTFERQTEDQRPKTKSVLGYVRKDLRDVKPYSSAGDEFKRSSSGSRDAFSFLDANENGLLTEYNRYPDPLQLELKAAISKVKSIPVENLFLGNGSDEVLDLIFRLTATAFSDSVAYLNPSYGMYSVLAKVNGVRTREINLDKEFAVSVETILQQAEGSKLLILCNPNNPTGAVMQKDQLIQIVEQFKGIVVVDEAYIDFCPEYSMADQIDQFQNLIVVQTLSKAYGMAGLRIGMAIASSEWVKALNSIKPPYNLSSLVQKTAIEVLNSTDWRRIKGTIILERDRILEFLKTCKSVENVFPSEANFILFRIENADEIYLKLLDSGVVVRNRSNQFNCENTLRVSVGNVEENNRFIAIMKAI